LFINSSKTSGAGISYEQVVWNQLKNTFEQQSTIAFHHYEMFFKNGVGKREIDILFIHQQLGVFVFEVKGLTIDQISRIQGHTWHYQNFREPFGSPTQQASDQLYMLCNDINQKELPEKSFNRYAVVTLPLITKAEWQSRGFNQQLNTPTPLFKDDLASPEKLIVRMEQITADNKKRELDNAQWKKIKNYFQIGDTSTAVSPNKTHKEFSELYVIRTIKHFEASKKHIENALNIGIKVYLLSYVSLPVYELELVDELLKQFQLNYYESNVTHDQVEANVYYNGKAIYPLLDTLEAHFSDFNVGQYKAIHYPVNAHQMISAGAGTGKTHVMIDRILYLIMNEKVELKDIIMITFTNASTNEMKERLENKFISLFNLTRDSKFLIYAEEVKDMQISTIHSFAKSILKSLAHEIGYGTNIKLRGFKNVKQQIIQQLMNEFFGKESIDAFLKSNIRYYEFIATANDLWGEMERKGLSETEITSLDWGKAEYDSILAQRLFQYIFAHCENRINIIKQQENAITIGDLIRKLKDFTNDSNKITQLHANCHIFVDEFQDSDDVQIELLASLQKFLNYKLFVVGDIKQSIYRFRGADYRSFEELKKKTTPFKYEVTKLQYNYRSSESLLNKMHLVFKRWGSIDWLTYDETDRLIGFSDSSSSCNEWKIVKHNKNNWEQEIKEALQAAVQDLNKPKQKIALIVRTNWDAKTMKNICDDLQIPTSENLDGTFFTSETVKHFKALIEGLLYSNEPKFLINALQTPYFGYSIPYHVFIEFGGNKEKIIHFINNCIEDDFSKYVNQLRLYSPMTVIQSIIHDKQLFTRLSTVFKSREMKGDMLKLNLLRYEKNLHHLMTLIEKNFNGANLSLHRLNQWLALQMNTNRSENEPILHDGNAKVEITTVHRSKGLEYDTVFIPITNKPYNSVKPKFYIQDSGELKENEHRKVGWKLHQLKNDGYFKLQRSESNEQQKEEVRLLYVAITRAKQKIIIAMPKSPILNSWSALLNSADVLKGAEL